MCFNPVTFKDTKHPHITNTFNCGVCSACKAEKASYRTRLIKSHSPLDCDGNKMICYFITLTYNNLYIPYVLKSELLKAQNHVFEHHDIQQVPIRRIKDPYNECHISESPIDYVTIEFGKNFRPFGPDAIDKLSPLQTKLRKGKVVDAFPPSLDESKYIDNFPISVCYSKDFQCFVKRLREYLYARYEDAQLSYYFAPEYGPTTSRFHIHALIWLPSFLSESQVKDAICDNWKYADRGLTEPYVIVPYDAAGYVSSYVNCSSDVSELLLHYFKLRPSHSLRFGFTKDRYSASQIYKNFVEKRDVSILEPHRNEAGLIEYSPSPCPSSLLYRYFPIFPGYTRVAYNSLLDALRDPKKFFSFSQDYNNLTDCSCGNTKDFNEYLYQSNIKDVYGSSLSFTVKQRDYFISRLRRAYLDYFKPLGLTYFEYCQLHVDFHMVLYSYRLKYVYTLSDIPPAEVIKNYRDALEHEFYDIDDYDFFKRNLTSFSYTSFSSTIYKNSLYNIKFHNNIKHRKLNSLNNV